MNPKFLSLSKEKQSNILNAGMEMFGKQGYKKAVTDDIASKAGISKGLLFYYFHNKKDLYLFLWEKCAKLTIESLEKNGCYDQNDVSGYVLGIGGISLGKASERKHQCG